MVIYRRRVFRFDADCSPNVRLAKAQRARGEPITGEIIVPGIMSWQDYCQHEATLDEHRKCVVLRAQWYEGPELKLFPALWLDAAEQRHEELMATPRLRRTAKGLGCDPAEGGDSSAWAIVDELGLIRLVSMKTPDTNVIPKITLDIMREHGIPPERVCFDRGGGKQHADRLRAIGYNVRTVGFGETVKVEPKRGLRQLEEKKEVLEDKYQYMNRRAEMYGELSDLMNPSEFVVMPLAGLNGMTRARVDTLLTAAKRKGFAIPKGIRGHALIKTSELRHQLEAIPKLYDKAGEGRLRMLPKNNPDDPTADSLVKRIGHSPDEADAVCLAVHAMLHKRIPLRAGAV